MYINKPLSMSYVIGLRMLLGLMAVMMRLLCFSLMKDKNMAIGMCKCVGVGKTQHNTHIINNFSGLVVQRLIKLRLFGIVDLVSLNINYYYHRKRNQYISHLDVLGLGKKRVGVRGLW